jgi:raffinose/stachyose/melibiose transport system substrate-binding protein
VSRRQFLKAAGVAAAGSVIAACTPAATQAPTQAPQATSGPAATAAAPKLEGSIEVGTFYEEGPWFDLHKSVGDSIIADNPGVEIKYTFANTASDAERVLRWQAGDPLDIDFGRFNNQAPATYQFADSNMLYDLVPHMDDVLPSGEKWGDTFVPLVNSMDYDQREGSAHKGARYGVPFELVLFLLQYNVKIFDELGVEPAATWPEFLTLCETIRSKGVKPICVSGPTFYYTAHWWDRLIQRIVGKEAVLDVAYGNAKLADNPGFLTAAQELQKLVDNDWLMDGYEGADFTSAQAMFFQDQAAMIHMGSWLTSEMKDSIPEGFQLAVVDFPTYPGGQGDQNAMFGTSQAMCIPNPAISTSHTVNVDLAVEFLKRRTSQAVCERAAQELAIVSPVKGVSAPPGVPGVDKQLERAATADFIIYYYGIHWDQALTNAWMVPTQALFLGQINAEQMIEQMDSELDKYRAQKAAGATASP